jgi:hypothetical protein
MNVPGAIKSPSRILSSALALGWAFDLLFYGQLPGLSVLLFVLFVLAVLVSLGRMDGISPRRQSLWLVVPIIFFAGMLAVRANPVLNAFNVLTCIFLLALLSYFYSAGRLERLGLIGYGFSLFIACVYALFRAAPLIPEGVNLDKLRSRSTRGTRTIMPVLRGLLLALPVAIVFIGLLASADVVFASWVGSLFSISLPNVQDALWHIVIILTVAWILAGGLAFAISRRGAAENEPWESVLDTVPQKIHIGFVEGAVVLTVVNVIFLAFGWIQLTYLFGGPANITSEGYTYADYARRGFFELVAVSVLTMALILGLHSFTWRETRMQSNVFKSLATLMVVLTCVLLASAFDRMWLYEEAYGFTHLRLIVHVFEIWLALLFCWLVFTLWANSRKFALGAFVAVLGFLATLNLINMDSTIAERNVARFVSTGNIDSDFLMQLSEDATPTLLANLHALSPADQERLLYSLGNNLQVMEGDENWRSVPSFNIARWQAYSALQASRALLAQYIQPVPPSGSTEGMERDYVAGDQER